MLRTLHGYLSRELLRVTVMALVAFTLVMTVFAIMEPLRKQGLATGQVAKLFGFTLPVMLSLTLPFAALLASTIVFGRFAQDREMLACRASGISTVTILLPAVALGVVVMIISLVLTNFVSPRMAHQAQLSIVQNIKRIAYHKIKKESHVKFGKKYIVHSTHVDEKNDALHGVVAGQYEFKQDPLTGVIVPVVHVMIASTAYLDIKHDEKSGKYYASVVLHDPVGPITNRPGGMIEEEEMSLGGIELENPSRDKPAFYEWDKLIRTLRDPTIHGEIRQAMEEIRRKIRRNRVLVQLEKAINGGGSYGEFRVRGRVLVIDAARAKVYGGRAALSGGVNSNGTPRPVKVTVRQAGSEQAITADKGVVSANWNPIWRKSQITVKLSGNVQVQMDKAVHGEAPRKGDWKQGEIPLPPDVDTEKMSDPKTPAERQAQISAIYQAPKQFTDDPGILADIASLKTDRPAKIRGKIVAEMHARIAFGLSCALLVSLGAALGIIFKGGQMLSAFTIAIFPAAANIIMILMGKKMISNPKSSDLAGMITIWGGVAAMLIADLVIYYRLSRK